MISSIQNESCFLINWLYIFQRHVQWYWLSNFFMFWTIFFDWLLVKFWFRNSIVLCWYWKELLSCLEHFILSEHKSENLWTILPLGIYWLKVPNLVTTSLKSLQINIWPNFFIAHSNVDCFKGWSDFFLWQNNPQHFTQELSPCSLILDINGKCCRCFL